MFVLTIFLSKSSSLRAVATLFAKRKRFFPSVVGENPAIAAKKYYQLARATSEKLNKK